MNTLWMSLLALILIALAVVVAFNLLQGRQDRLRGALRERLSGDGRRRAAGGTPAAEGGGASVGHGDARIDPRIEPTLSADGGPAAAPADPDRTTESSPLERPSAPTDGVDSTHADVGDGPRTAANDGTAGDASASGPGASPRARRDVADGAVGAAGDFRASDALDDASRDGRGGPTPRPAPDENPGASAAGGAAPAVPVASAQDASAPVASASVASVPASSGGPALPSPGDAAAPAAPPAMPGATGAPVAGGSGQQPPEAPALRATLDPRLDCIVEIAPVGPVGGDRLLGLIGGMRRAGSKPILVEVDGGDGRWLLPTAGRSYRRLRIGVLLANRHGPLNAMEFSEFGNSVQALGRHFGVRVELPEMARALDHARELDEACAQLDAQIGLNVETPTALSPGELAALASGLDMVERGNNRFARLGPAGEVLFSLALGDRADLLTLLLDVPRAPQGQQPWQQMLECAQDCAERSGGRLVDDAGTQLTEAAAAAVTRRLGQRYRSLDEAGLTAGSPAALRVFN